VIEQTLYLAEEFASSAFTRSYWKKVVTSTWPCQTRIYGGKHANDYQQFDTGDLECVQPAHQSFRFIEKVLHTWVV